MAQAHDDEYIKDNFFVFIDVHDKFYKVTNSEPLQYETGRETTAHFSVVAAGGTSGFINITTLEPDDIPRKLFQVRAGVKYGMRYYFKLPSGSSRFGVDVDKSIGYLTEGISPYNYPSKLFEFWLVNDHFVAIDARNDTSIALTPKIQFTGKKYDLTEIKEDNILLGLKNGSIPFRFITIGGVRF
ncbi:hypothetical protein LCGC14_2125170 [marine sediment metagenome]|uniref:Uncharacterized protein n=1 Tax=marine sediment metagenome TaxID=412755 RepID=A0A0F9E312_9ZZZZ